MPITPGLTVIARSNAPSGHLNDVILDGQALYVGTSGAGIDSYQMDSAGTLTFEFTGRNNAEPETAGRCTSIGLHKASSTIVCTAIDTAGVGLYDVSNPSAPVLREGGTQQTSPPAPGYSDNYVTGDFVYLAALQLGLQEASISATGALGPVTTAALTATGDAPVVGVDGDADLVVAVLRDGTLVSFRSSAGALTELGRVTLGGPPMRVVVHGTQAGVALGSHGLALVDLSAAPKITEVIDAQAEVLGCDFDAARLVLATSGGALLYDLSATPPRLAGFDPAANILLDARFADDKLIVSDWNELRTVEVNAAGHGTRVEQPRGFLIEPGIDGLVEVRSRSDVPLHVTAHVVAGQSEMDIATATIAPGATAMFTVPAALIDVASVGYGTTLTLVADEDGAASPYSPTYLVQGGTALSAGHIGVGDPFPTFYLASSGQPATPTPAMRNYEIFVQVDCQMQWPEMIDLAWLSAHDEIPAELLPTFLLLAPGDANAWYGAPFIDNLGVQDIGYRLFDSYSMTLPGFQSSSPMDAFNDLFAVDDFVPGGDVSIDYIVDEKGMVAATDRFYRGSHPLRLPF